MSYTSDTDYSYSEYTECNSDSDVEEFEQDDVQEKEILQDHIIFSNDGIDEFLPDYIRLLFMILNKNGIHEVAVIGDTVYSDLASLTLKRGNIDYLRFRTNTPTVLFDHQYPIYGDKSKKYYNLDEIEFQDIDWDEVEDHVGVARLDRSMKSMISNGVVDLNNLKDELEDNFIVKRVINLSSKMTLIVTEDYNAFLVRKIIRDDTNLKVDKKQLRVISYYEEGMKNMKVDEITDENVSDLYSLETPRRFQYKNTFNVNPFHFPSSLDPFAIIMTLVHHIFVLKK